MKIDDILTMLTDSIGDVEVSGENMKKVLQYIDHLEACARSSEIRKIQVMIDGDGS